MEGAWQRTVIGIDRNCIGINKDFGKKMSLKIQKLCLSINACMSDEIQFTEYITLLVRHSSASAKCCVKQYLSRSLLAQNLQSKI